MGLLLGIHVTPVQLEVLLKGAPFVMVLLGMLGLCLIQLDPLPIGSLPTAQLEGPLDLDRVCQKVHGIQLDVCVTFQQECKDSTGGPVEVAWQGNLEGAAAGHG